MNTIILIFIALSFAGLHIDNNQFIEKGSKKIFTIEANYDLDNFNIKIESGKFIYTENLIIKGDTFFIISRNIRYGILSASAFYDPPRPRIVFPIINSDTLYYTGTESITGLKRKVESYVFSITDSNKTSIIKNVTVRGESTDEYEIHIDSTGLINYISMDLPVFSMFCKIMGLRSNQLEFVPYEEY